jgi:excisionase family DNA binding protein
MLTVKQSANLAGISAGLVYLWVEQGVLPHFRLGRPGSRGAIRIAEDDLQRFLQSMKQETKPQEALAAPSRTRPKADFRHLRLG